MTTPEPAPGLVAALRAALVAVSALFGLSVAVICVLLGWPLLAGALVGTAVPSTAVVAVLWLTGGHRRG